MAVGIETVAEPGEVASAPPPADRIYRLSIDQYHRMIEADIFGPEDRVELLEGILVAKMTKNSPHNIATELLDEFLHQVIPRGWYVSSQNPVTLDVTASEPEPDAKLVRGRPRDYHGRKPGPTDIALIVEVSDSSLTYDRTVKKRVYAQDGVPVYWIVNLVDNQLEVFTEPAGLDYRVQRILGPDEAVSLVLDGREIARILVRDLLP